MKKIILSFLFVLIFVLIAAPAALASEKYLSVNDSAGILTAAQCDGLNARAEAIAEKYGCAVIIVVINDMYDLDINYARDDGDAYVFNKTIYETLNLGYGEDKSCLLLAMSMADRDYWLEPYGYAKTAFTRHGIDVMLDRHMLPLMKENNFYAAFSAYLDKSEEYLRMAREGSPFDTDTDPVLIRNRIIAKTAVIVLLPSIIALIVCLIWRSQMKTAKPAFAADKYIPEGGFKLTGQTDTFLYRVTTRVKIETSSGSGSGSGSSSSGSSGRGGKF